MKLNLKSKNALVCGSTQGIGQAIALSLAAEGANVTLLARNEESLQQVQKQLSPIGEHNYIVADFSEPENLLKQLDQYLEQHNNFHILVNNTGGPPAGSVTQAKPEEFQAAFSQHLLCNHLLAQRLIPGMKKHAYGRIINIISTSVKQPIEGLGVSNTIRGAVANWSKTLASEVGPFGITVNNVLPGATATERLTAIIKSKAAKLDIDVSAASDLMQNAIPAKRFADPEEIANAVTFLASEAAAYINGVNLPVDGGRTKSL